MLYIRKQAKGFGRNARIEGTFKEGANILLVEDLATDGGSKISFINAIRDAGGRIEHCFVVFHYGNFPESTKNLQDIGVSLHGLCTWWDVLEVAATRNYTPEQLSTVRDFLDNPDGWADQNQLK
jgi:orotate phosphoribosyltransferase